MSSSPLARFARRQDGFTGAEKALVACFALAILLLLARLLLSGGADAATDAARTLVTRSGGSGSERQLGTMLSPGRIQAVDGIGVERSQVPPGLSVGLSVRGADLHPKTDPGGFWGGVGDFFGGVASGVASVAGNALSFGAGAIDQFASNVFFGAFDRFLDLNNDPAFRLGRHFGDGLSFAAGALEIVGGILEIGAGFGGIGVLEIASLGIQTPVVPLEAIGVIAVGAALVGHGIWMMKKGLDGHQDPPGGNGEPSQPSRQQRLEDLARDPAHNGEIGPKSQHEAEVGLTLEERGELPGPIRRDPTGAAEFIDRDGVKWDVKGFNSNYPPQKGGFSLERDLGKVQAEFDRGENVILDTTQLSPEDAEALRQAVDERGWGSRIRWYP